MIATDGEDEMLVTHHIVSWIESYRAGWFQCSCGETFRTKGFDSEDESMGALIAAHQAALPDRGSECSWCSASAFLVPSSSTHVQGARTLKIPPDFQAWMDQRALTVVPVAAAELLEKAVDIVQERNILRAELHEAMNTRTPWADRLEAANHRAVRLQEMHAAAENVIDLMRRGQNADDAYREWRQIVNRQDRRTA